MDIFIINKFVFLKFYMSKKKKKQIKTGDLVRTSKNKIKKYIA